MEIVFDRVLIEISFEMELESFSKVFFRVRVQSMK